MSSRRPAIGFIFVTLMLDVMGFGLLIPVFPRLVESIQGLGEAEAAKSVGWLISMYAAMQFIFAPILGALSDRFGRRPILLIALFGSGIDYFAGALAPTLAWLYITRALNGLSGASMSVASAYIADVTPPEKRAQGFGLIGAAFGLGFVIGPLVGGLVGDANVHIPFIGPGSLRYPFYVAGTLTLINWLFGCFVVPESLPPERRAKFSLARANPIGAFRGLGKNPIVAELAATLFFVNVAQFALHATWVLYTKHRYGWTPKQVALSLFAVGLGAAIVQGGLAGRVVKIIGERAAMMIGLVIAILAYVGYASATEGWMIYVMVCFASLGGIAQPAIQAIITKTVGPSEQGATQGTLTALQNVAQIIGPYAGAHIFAAYVDRIPGAALYVSAALTLVGTLFAVWAAHKRRAALADKVSVS